MQSLSVPENRLRAWTVWMQAAGLSNRTIQGRADTVRLLARRHSVDPAEATWEILAQFLANCPSPGTRQVYRSQLVSFYHWLVLTDQRIDDPTIKLHKGRPVKRKPRPVSLDQLDAMLRQPMHHMTMPKLLLGAYEGFRVHEIAKFRGEDIDGDTIRVIGKGGILGEVPLHPLVAKVAERMPPRGYWFPSHNRLGPVQPNSVSVVVGKLMRRAGLPPSRTAHSLRHFFGTEELRATGNLRLVQQLMRHENIASTVLYTEIDREVRLAAVLALPVPSRLRLVA